MCCSLAPAGRDLLEARGIAVDASAEGAGAGLRQIRHELHAAGWALAFAALHGGGVSLRGRAGSVGTCRNGTTSS